MKHVETEVSKSTVVREIPVSKRAGRMYLTIAVFCASVVGCGVLPEKPAAKPMMPIEQASSKAAEQLKREIVRLKAELARAEETLVAVESGLQSGYTRADAVKAMAEAQIQLEKTKGVAPWHAEEIAQAQSKLKTAQSHIDAGRFGAALFFVYRVNSIVKNVNSEAEAIRTSPNLLFVSNGRANLRDGPSTDHKIITTLTEDTPLFLEEREKKWALVRTLSGTVGWIHVELVTRERPEGMEG